MDQTQRGRPRIDTGSAAEQLVEKATCARGVFSEIPIGQKEIRQVLGEIKRERGL